MFPQITILNVIGFLWKNKAAIGIVLAAGSFAYFIWLAEKRGKERDQLEKSLATAEQTIIDQAAGYDTILNALEKKALNDKGRSEFERGETQRNQADRVAGDGPLAPVLRNGFHKLSLRQAERQN